MRASVVEALVAIAAGATVVVVAAATELCD